MVLQTGLPSEDGAMFSRTAMTRHFTGPVPMGAQNSRACLPNRCSNMVPSITSPVPTRRTSRRTLRASTEPCARNTWGGHPIEWTSCPRSRARRVHSGSVSLSSTIRQVIPERPLLAPSSLGQDGLSDIYGENCGIALVASSYYDKSTAEVSKIHGYDSSRMHNWLNCTTIDSLLSMSKAFVKASWLTVPPALCIFAL